MKIKQYSGQSIGDILQKDLHLTRLCERSDEIARLNLLFQKILPLSISAQCQLTNSYHERLIVYTTQANCASLLRFHAPSLCRKLSKLSGSHFTRLVIKICPSTNMRIPLPKRSLSLPRYAGEIMEKTANSLDNKSLSDALTRLASRAI